MKKWLSIAGLSLMTIAMTGCLKDENKEAEKSENKAASEGEAEHKKVKETVVQQEKFDSNKVYKVSVDADFFPMGFDENGQHKGFTTELVTVAAEKVGIKIELVPVPFDNIFDHLESEKIDIIANSASINADRKNKYLFSDAYFIGGSGFLMKKTNQEIRDFNDAIRKGNIIAVEKGSTTENMIAEAKGANANEVLTLDSFDETLKAIKNGKATASYGELSILNSYLKDNPDLKVVEDTLKQKADFYGFLSRQNQEELIDKLNEGLNLAKIDGTYMKLYNKYFGEK